MASSWAQSAFEKAFFGLSKGNSLEYQCQYFSQIQQQGTHRMIHQNKTTRISELKNSIAYQCMLIQKEPKIGEGKFYEVDADFTESKNFTFGIGDMWIKSFSRANWAVPGLQILILLVIANKKRGVSKGRSQLAKIVELELESADRQLYVSNHFTIQRQISSFFNYIESLSCHSREQIKIKKICEKMQDSPGIHFYLQKYLVRCIGTVENLSTRLLNDQIEIRLELVENRTNLKKFSCNQQYTIEIRRVDDDAEFKIQKLEDKLKIRKSNRRLVRKSTVKSEGQLSDDEKCATVKLKKEANVIDCWPTNHQFSFQAQEHKDAISMSTRNEKESENGELLWDQGSAFCNCAFQNPKTFTIYPQYHIEFNPNIKADPAKQKSPIKYYPKWADSGRNYRKGSKVSFHYANPISK